MAEHSSFVKNAKFLDRLKTSATFPDTAYENGKYILLLKSDMVCVEANRKLLWKDFKGIQVLGQKTSKPLTVILDVVTDVDLGQICLFAADFEAPNDIQELESEIGGKFINSRQSLMSLNEIESEYVTQARGLISFCRTTKYCSACGGKLVSKSAGNQKECTECKKSFYPPVAPVGITLIENKAHNKVLLVRQSRHPKGMYSCVAGFIEPGESLEQNIQREVAEEVGVEIDNIQYSASQHWAMPGSQLMLGCIATAKNEDFEKDDNEIQDAKWVEAEQLRDAVERAKKAKSMSDISAMTLWVPPPTAVAHQLMSTWLQKHHSYLPPVTSHI